MTLYLIVSWLISPAFFCFIDLLTAQRFCFDHDSNGNVNETAFVWIYLFRLFEIILI